jgi:ATP adenylyltransferase
MEALHAPWRIHYILGPKAAPGEQSVFTRIGQSNDDEANYVVLRGKAAYAMLNNFPYNGGHLMVIPYREVPDFDDLTDEELLEMMKLVRQCKRALTKAMQPHGFNIGVNLGKVAGAGIQEHLHIHVVPRWTGDVNFMPVIANTTVLPEALRETAAKIRAALKADQNS